jgi:hypothetical protein
VTPVSHLVASYHAATGASEAEAIARVKQLLGIGRSESLNRPYASTWLSAFSPAAFMAAAARAGGIAPLTAALVAQMEAGTPHRFQDPDPYAAIRLPFSTAASNGAAKSANGLATELFFKGLSNFVGSDLGGIVVSPLKWLVSKLAMRIATNRELKQINEQITQIQDQLSQLSTALNALATQSLAISVTAKAIVYLNTFTQTEKAQSAATAGYVPFSPASTTTLSPQGLLGLLDQSGSFTYAEIISNACLSLNGLGNLVCGFNQAFGATYGSGGAVDGNGNPSTTPSFLSTAFLYDFRNDVLTTPSVQNCSDFYVAYMAEAANMLSESYNQALAFAPPNTSGQFPAPTIALGLNVMNGGNQAVGGGLSANGLPALIKRMVQQRPLALLGGQSGFPSTIWAAPGDPYKTSQPDTALGLTYANGTMWAAPGYEFTSSGDDTRVNIKSTVQGFSVNRYEGWSIPSKADVQRLAARAFQAGVTAGHTGTNAIPYGLMKMGLLTQTSYNASPNDVKIYCDLNGTSMEVYDSASGGFDNNGYGDNGDFKPQGGKLTIVLLGRPFPGAPQGASIYPGIAGNFGDGNLGGNDGLQPTAPSYILNSKTYATLQGANYYVNTLQSDVVLAGSFPPNEIVIVGDGTDPHQQHAYGIWAVGCDLHYNAGGGNINQYLVYTEITDYVEWLSSDRTAADVTNFPALDQAIVNGTLSGASIVADGSGSVAIENPVISGSSITGGTVYNAGSLSGTVSGGTLGGAPYSGTVSNASLAGGTITAGTVSGGTLYTVTNTDGSPTGTLLLGASLSGATITGGSVVVPQGSLTPGPAGLAGYVVVHDRTRPVTITASWMYNPNLAGFTARYVTVPGTSAYPSVTFPANTFADVPQLSYAIISPNNQRLQLTGSGSTAQPFYLTGFYSDGSVRDLTTAATWKCFLPTVNGQTITLGPENTALFGAPALPYQLLFPSTFKYSGDLVVTATAGGTKAISVINVLSPP